MRVGFWRLLEVLNKFNLKATLAINGSVCKSYPRVARAGLDSGWNHGARLPPAADAHQSRINALRSVKRLKK